MTETDPEVSKVISIINSQLPFYKNAKYLGDGATSYCFQVEHEHLGIRAIKVAKLNILERNPDLKDLFIEEIGILSKIQHKNVVIIYDLGKLALEDTNIPYYVMEYFSYDLNKFFLCELFPALEREDLISIFRQSAEGLKHIHKVVSHNDIKESNIFLDHNLNVKIGDFGFAKYFSQSSSPDTQHGSPDYWCNELKTLLKEKSKEHPNNTVIIIKKKDRKPKWDIFALGIVYENIIKKYLEKRPGNGLDNEDRKYLTQLIEKMKLETDKGIKTADEVVNAIDKMKKTLWTSLVVPELTSHPRKTTVRIPEQDTIYISEKVNLIVNHPWFQRLKNVRQLGLAYLHDNFQPLKFICKGRK
jgi:serine/threonine protein kinase